MAICPSCKVSEIGRGRIFRSFLFPSHFTVLMCNKCGALLDVEKGWFAELLSDMFLLFSGFVVLGVMIVCMYTGISFLWGAFFMLSWHAARSWLKSRRELIVCS